MLLWIYFILKIKMIDTFYIGNENYRQIFYKIYKRRKSKKSKNCLRNITSFEKFSIDRDRSENYRQPHSLRIGDLTFEVVHSFNYLCILIRNDNSMHTCINERIVAANRTYYAHLSLFKSK